MLESGHQACHGRWAVQEEGLQACTSGLCKRVARVPTECGEDTEDMSDDAAAGLRGPRLFNQTKYGTTEQIDTLGARATGDGPLNVMV